MTGLVLEVLFNIFIAGLLVMTIGYCWVLNRRIRVLQDSRSELAQLIKHFDESTEKASSSIVALQTASKKIGEAMQERVEKANFMADDLAFLIEKSAKSADQLESLLKDAQQQRRAAPVKPGQPIPARSREFAPAAPPAFSKPAEPIVPPQPERAHASATPRETMSAIRKAVADAKSKEPEPSARARTHASLEAVLERMASRREAEETEAPPQSLKPDPAAAKRRAAPPALDSSDAARPRTRAERELLDIIKAGSQV